MKIKLKKIAVLLTTCCLALASLPLLANSQITKIVTDKAPSATGPFSQAIRAGSYIFVSGQLAIDPASGKLIGDTIEEQTKQALKNIEAILADQGLTLENVVKAEVFLKDLKDYSSMNTIYSEKFSYATKPARVALQVARLPLDALVEISCIAFIPNESTK